MSQGLSRSFPMGQEPSGRFVRVSALSSPWVRDPAEEVRFSKLCVIFQTITKIHYLIMFLESNLNAIIEPLYLSGDSIISSLVGFSRISLPFVMIIDSTNILL